MSEFKDMFERGGENTGFAQYFIGRSWLCDLYSDERIGVHNVTFEPGCRNNWHIHHAEAGGGQLLLCVAGEGLYQEWGKPAQRLSPGTVVYIRPGVKHWHGAEKESWFSHIAIGLPGDDCRAEWLEPVDDEAYAAANAGA